MKITVSKKELSTAIKDSMKIIKARMGIAVLANIHFHVHADGLTLTTSDGDNTIRKTIEIDETNELAKRFGTALADGKQFNARLKKMKGTEITLEYKDETFILSDGKITFQMESINAEYYPILSESKGQYEFAINKKELISLIQSVTHAKSNLESRPVLTGILIEYTKSLDELVVSACDSHRLAVNRLTTTEKTNNEDSLRVVANGQGMDLLTKVNFIGEELFLQIDNSNLTITDGLTEVTARTIVGTYPDLTRLIPNVFSTNLVTDKDDLLTAVENCELVTSTDRLNTLVFNITSEETIVMAGTDKNKTEMKLNGCEGENMELHCNATYIKEALKVTGDKVSLEFVSPIRPFIITEKNSKLVQLVTPIRNH